jgi:hypothetical protein
MAKLQRSRKDEEQRRKKNLPKLVQRRCNGSEHIEGDPISQQCHEEERRQRHRRRRSRTSSSIGAGVEQVDDGASSLFSRSGRRVQETEEQRKKTMVWGKKEKFYPHCPIYTSPGKGRGGGSALLPRPFLR